MTTVKKNTTNFLENIAICMAPIMLFVAGFTIIVSTLFVLLLSLLYGFMDDLRALHKRYKHRKRYAFTYPKTTPRAKPKTPYFDDTKDI